MTKFSLLASLWAVAAAAQPAPPPDVLLLMPDQMRGDCLSIAGHPTVRTPAIDGLARAGARFRRAYATVPSCIPARHALLTGRFPQTSGVVGFKGRPITVPTLPRLLAGAGYRTELVGRNMHQFPASDDLGFAVRVLGSTYVDGDAYDEALRAAVPDSGGIRALVRAQGLSFNGWEAGPWPLDDAWHPTAWVAGRAAERVAAAAPDVPLFLAVSFYAPHSPLFPPRALFDAYLQRELPAPARGDWVDRSALSPDGDRAGHRVILEGEALRRAQAGYFGLIEHVDACCAPLIAAFRARSEAAGREWLVIVTSDHGELLGDHGFYRKCEPYEGSCNIPLVVAGSAGLGLGPGVVSDRPVCLEDVFATVLDLAGVPAPAGTDGVSLAPALRGEPQEVRPWLHLEHATCYSRQQAFHALTDGQEKYVWRPLDGAEQLFDLAADPREERDLAALSEHRDAVGRWRALLVERLAGRPEGFSDGEELIAGRPYPPLTGGDRR